MSNFTFLMTGLLMQAFRHLGKERAHRSPSRKYFVAVGDGIPSVRVVNTSRFQHGSENAWVGVEKYLTGKVVNAGGKQDPNVQLVLSDSGENVRVSATEQLFRSRDARLLY